MITVRRRRSLGLPLYFNPTILKMQTWCSVETWSITRSESWVLSYSYNVKLSISDLRTTKQASTNLISMTNIAPALQNALFARSNVTQTSKEF